MKYNKSFLIAATMLTAHAQIASADVFVHDDINLTPRPEKFNICHGGTCEYLADVSLEPEQWDRIKDSFINNRTAKQERNNIRDAIAKMETMVGKLTDTYNDKAENVSDKELNHYMDCIDESTNTTLYMTMMKQEGLIHWHTIEDRENRGFFFNGWPHTTAVIKDINTGSEYAVDSWFLNNGEQPFVIPLHEWNEGWRPEK